MKISSNDIAAIVQALANVEQLSKKFYGFHEVAQSEIKKERAFLGVEVGNLQEDNTFEVSALGVKLRFAFVVSRPSGAGLSGHVVCQRLAPSYSDVPVVVGSIKFDGAGMCDVETDSPAGGPIELTYCGREIVLGALLAALELPVPVK